MELTSCHRPRQADGVWKRLTLARDTSGAIPVSSGGNLEDLLIHASLNACDAASRHHRAPPEHLQTLRKMCTAQRSLRQIHALARETCRGSDSGTPSFGQGWAVFEA